MQSQGVKMARPAWPVSPKPPRARSRRFRWRSEARKEASKEMAGLRVCQTNRWVAARAEAADLAQRYDAFDLRECRCEIRGDNGTAVVATTSEVKEGDLLLSVPLSEAIGALRIADSPIALACRGLQEDWLKIALWMIHAREIDAKWAPFLSSGLNAGPLAWPDGELQALDGTQTLGTIRAYQSFLNLKWDEIRETVLASNPGTFDPDVFTRENFFWAVATLKANAAPLGSGELVVAPLANAVRHSRRPNCALALSSSGLLRKEAIVNVVATRDVARGETLCADLGQGKPEQEVFVDYGVVDAENPSVGMQLTLELSDADANFDDKCDILALQKLGPSTVFPVEISQPLPPELLGFLRLIQLGGEDSFLLEAIFRQDCWDFLLEPVSEENEEAVCKGMIGTCKQALGALAGVGTAGGTAGKVRECERLVLEHLLGIFEEEREEIPYKEFYQERRLKSMGLLDLDGNSTY